MSDIPTSRDGESVMQALRRSRNPRDYAPSWGNVQHPEPGWSQRGEKPNTVSASQYGAVPENTLAAVQAAGRAKELPQPLIPKGGSYQAPLPDA